MIVNPKNNPEPTKPQQPAESAPAPRKRFRIEKLEERIAPTKGGNSNGKGHLPDSSIDQAFNSIY
jgi:hypothetical protein